jgi:hypothetical protein
MPDAAPSSDVGRRVSRETRRRPFGRSAKPLIDHVVLLRVAAEASREDIAVLRRDVEALEGEIDGVEAVRWGASTSPEGLEQGYTHGFVMRLRDDAARRVYLPHPAHAAVAERIHRICDDVLVFDISS